uniref:Zinc ribbon domain-containing protein n=1 Tax=candidate division WOR-3 bacterium TaxID=2052148 RepID=A0A7C4X7Q8_UNCW3
MKCPECKREITKKMNFCPFCGHRFDDPFGIVRGFEWKSGFDVLGYPLIHIAVGKDVNGKIRVAKGIIAIGQFGIGLITIAQFGVGLLFGLGQFVFGLVTVGQFAIGILFGLGQFATGYIVIGQIAFGWYALCQTGFAKYMWSSKIKNPEAVEFFRLFWQKITNLFGI